MSAHYPLLFGYRDLLEGDGFVAVVEICGRALLAEESEGDVWMYGVNPGAMAGGGQTPREAMAAFRSEYQAILFDFAEETTTFEAFKQQVEDFFAQTNKPNEVEWRKAVEDVRAGRVEVDWLTKQREWQQQLRVVVHKIGAPSAKDNALPREELAA